MAIVFWLGIILLVDASLSLLNQDYLKKFIKISNIYKIFWIELLFSFILLTIFFFKRYML
tara:strand:+ start:1698 stop:1877 length:180 start_codon:yes stop_codon:yes gene_type:complete